jgi:hypothetical protein
MKAKRKFYLNTTDTPIVSTDAPVIVITTHEEGYKPLYTSATADDFNDPEIPGEVLESAEAGSAFGWDCGAAKLAIEYSEKNKEVPPIKPYHYFASSALNWAAKEDLGEVIEDMKRMNKANGKDFSCTTAALYKVPTPHKFSYSIENFVPVVEGVKFIDYFSL